MTSGRGAGPPELVQIFAYDIEMPISIQNTTARRFRSGPTMPENGNSQDGCTFPSNIFAPTPKISPKPHFWGHFNAKPIIQIALRKSHVHNHNHKHICKAPQAELQSSEGETLQVYRYRQVLGGMSKFFRQGHPGGGAGPLNVNLRPPIISETTGARKLKLETQLDVVKYSLRVQKIFRQVAFRGRRAP